MQKLTVKKLERWLKQDPSRKAQLAFKLGLSSTASVMQWIRRNKIPARHHETIKVVLK